MLIIEATGHIEVSLEQETRGVTAGHQEVSNLRTLMQWPSAGSQEVGGHFSSPFHPFSLMPLQTKGTKFLEEVIHSRSGARTAQNEPGTCCRGQKTRKLFKVNGVMADDTGRKQAWRGGAATLHRGQFEHQKES